MSTNEILIGLGLVVVLGIGCRLIAERLGVPAIVLLLPAGFLAGVATTDVHPDNLFGDTFQPLVSLGVSLILFEAGLRLNLRELQGGIRGVVLRLITIGVLLTLASIAIAAKLIFDLSSGVALVLGAILVVSGPTVVMPLLEFVRPSDRVRSTLKWEGALIDPIGALLGVVAFHAVQQGIAGERPFHAGELTFSLGAGLVIGAAGAGALWLLLRALQRTAPREGIPAALMVVTAAVVGADLLREDSGFVAAIVMGLVLANQRELDTSRILEFHGTVVNLLIGMLFVLISASVTVSQVRAVLPETLVLIALMALVIRPAVVALASWRSELSWRERAFASWMAPRGIVAAATASAFGLELSQSGVAGAEQILPIAFVTIFGTVVLYGLTGAPVARLLGVAGAGAEAILLVGGQRWARAIATALQGLGIEVRLWTGDPEEQVAAREAGVPAGKARLSGDLESREAELEEVSAVLLLTESDDFNALAAFELRRELGADRVYRLAPDAEPLDLVPHYAEGGILFDRELTFSELSRRFDAGARLVEVESEKAGGNLPGTGSSGAPLFLISAEGNLRVVLAGSEFERGAGERALCLVG